MVLHQPNWPVEHITGLIEFVSSKQTRRICFFNSGLTNDDLSICREWMKPFYEVLRQSTATTNASIRSSLSIPMDEIYSLQMHNISIEMLVNVMKTIFLFMEFAFLGKCQWQTLENGSNIEFQSTISRSYQSFLLVSHTYRQKRNFNYCIVLVELFYIYFEDKKRRSIEVRYIDVYSIEF